MDPALLAFGMFLLGSVVGALAIGAKWRQNAKQIHRIESGGRLYKVYQVEPGQWHLSNTEYVKACTAARAGR